MRSSRSARAGASKRPTASSSSEPPLPSGTGRAASCSGSTRASPQRVLRPSASRQAMLLLRPSTSTGRRVSRAWTTSTSRPGGLRSCCSLPAPRRASTASSRRRTPASCRRSGSPSRRGVAEPLTILIAARDEEARIGETVADLKRAFPAAQVLVADDGSRDGTAAAAERAGARVVRLPRLGKGQALTLAEPEATPGRLLLADADVQGDLVPLLDEDVDLAVARFAD